MYVCTYVCMYAWGQGVFLSTTNRKEIYGTSKDLYLLNFHIRFWGLLLEVLRKLLYFVRIKTQLLGSSSDLCDVVSIFY